MQVAIIWILLLFSIIGFPVEDRDFDISEVVISFPAGNMQVQGINITIVDDGINEVEQIFVIFLRVVDAVNPDRVNLQFEGGRNATLGIILDDDSKCGARYEEYGSSNE